MPGYWKKRDTGLRLRGVNEFRQFLKNLQKECLTGSNVFHDVGKAGIDMIRKRTLKGIGVDGKPFQKLTPKYAKIRGYPVRRLSSTGDGTKGMLGAIRYRQGNRKIVIYVKNEYPEYIKAEVHNFGMISGRRAGRFQMPQSYFFGFTEREYFVLYRFVQKNVDQFVDTYWKTFVV